MIKKSKVDQVIEKTPRHLRCIFVLPKTARLILIKRNIKDTILSNYSAPWNAHRSFYRVLIKVITDRLYMLIAQVFFKSRLSIINFDDFLTDPEKQIYDKLANIGLHKREHAKEIKFRTRREFWKQQSNSSLSQRKKTVGAWPRFGTTNIRNTLMYNSIEKFDRVKIYDLKKQPFLGFFCDIIHLHWPEKAFEGKASFLKVSLFLVYCFLLKVSGTKIVQTVHNDWNNHVPNQYTYLYKLYQNHVNIYFVPTQSSMKCIHPNAKFKLLPLGLYPKITESTDKKYHLIVGRLTRKKGILELMSMELPETDTLVVAGSAEDMEYEHQICDAAEKYGVKTHLGHLTEDEIHKLVAGCKSVIVNYKVGLNSGILTLAATYNKPVVTNLTHLKRDMERLYGQNFSEQLSCLKQYQNTGLDIHSVAQRLNKIFEEFL